MCMGGSPSTPAPPPPPPAPEPAKEPNSTMVRNRSKKYKAAGLAGTNVTGSLGTLGQASTTKTMLGA